MPYPYVLHIYHEADLRGFVFYKSVNYNPLSKDREN